jgi:hypothetical protein
VQKRSRTRCGETSRENDRRRSWFELAHGGITVSRVVNPFRPSAVHQAIACTARVLLVMVSIAMTHSLVRAQSSSVQGGTPLPPSRTAHEESGDSQSTSLPHGPLDQEVTTPCSLRVPDVIPQPAAEGEGATPPHAPLAYTPLSVRCRFRLFLSSTYSPYTLRPRPRVSGPTMAEARKVGRSDLVRLWRIQNRADSSRGLLCRRSCIRILAIFPRPRESSSLGHGIPRPGW